MPRRKVVKVVKVDASARPKASTQLLLLIMLANTTHIARKVMATYDTCLCNDHDLPTADKNTDSYSSRT